MLPWRNPALRACVRRDFVRFFNPFCYNCWMQNKFIYIVIILALGVGGFLFYRSQTAEIEVEVEEDGGSEVVNQMPAPGSEGEGVEEMVVEWEQYSMTEVAKHNTRADCWAVVNGSVYGLTEWIAKHPGGAEAIIQLCGKDGSSLFNNQHGEFAQALQVLAGLKIGVLAN